jgi:hypothetical protein
MMIQTLNPNKNHTDYLTLKSSKIIKQEIYKNSKDRLVRETLLSRLSETSNQI